MHISMGKTGRKVTRLYLSPETPRESVLLVDLHEALLLWNKDMAENGKPASLAAYLCDVEDKRTREED